MACLSPSALITDKGRRVLLRIQGRSYQFDQRTLRNLLGLPAGPAGLGITIDGDNLEFELAADNQRVKMSAAQLHRRLAKHPTANP
jgi:hypothetical protein